MSPSRIRRLWVSTYELRPRFALNPVTQKHSRPGALLRMEDRFGRVGFADCHPWPEFGDLPLADQLERLARLELTSLTASSLRAAEWDAEARAAGVSLEPEAGRVASHYFLRPAEGTTLKQELAQAIGNGYRRFKVKIGREPRALLANLREASEKLPPGSLWRFDSNSVLSLEEVEGLLRENKEWLPQRLDFWEDPFPFDRDQWRYLRQNYGLRLAFDMAAASPPQGSQLAFDFIVVKPAVQDAFQVFKQYWPGSVRFVITHRMDHPLGQTYAQAVALRAQVLYGQQVVTGGLHDPGFYEKIENCKEHLEEARWLELI